MLFLLLLACFAPNDMRETLEKSGFTDIEVGDYSWFACSKGDTFATEFVATNVQGQEVSGTVCCGLLKSCTVRF